MPKRYTESERRAAHLRKYGLSDADYAAKVIEQDGLCAVCHQPETAVDRKGGLLRLAVDHDHKTGKVRGLLCLRCNLALGYAGEDPVTLAAMIAYVLKHS